MKIDRARFLSLVVAMSAAPMFGCGGASEDEGASSSASSQQGPGTSGAEGSAVYAPQAEVAATDECIDWDATGECIGWEGYAAAPTAECIDWDATGECIDWAPAYE